MGLNFQTRWMMKRDSKEGHLRRSSPFVRIEFSYKGRFILTIVWMSWIKILINPAKRY